MLESKHEYLVNWRGTFNFNDMIDSHTIKPFLLMICAVIIMVMASYIRFIITGIVKVDQNSLDKWPAFLNYVLIFVSLSMAGYAYIKVIFKKPHYSLTVQETKNLSIIMACISFFMMPMLSNDIFSVLAYGSLPFEGVNPYTGGRFLSRSPFFLYIGSLWNTAPCVYGPINLSLSVLSVFAGRGNLYASMAVYKTIILISGIVFICILYSYIQNYAEHDRYNVAALILLAPVLWIQGVGQAHNDLISITWLAAAFYCIRMKRIYGAALLLSLAILSKFLAIIAIPLFITLAVLKYHEERRRMMIRLFVSFLIFCGACIVVYLPYWHGVDTIVTPVMFLMNKKPTNTIAVSIKEILEVMKALITCSSLRPFLSALDTQAAMKGINWVLKIVAVLVSIWMMIRMLGKKNSTSFFNGYVAIMAATICIYSPSFLPWYLMFLLPLLVHAERYEWIEWTAIIFIIANFVGLAQINQRTFEFVLVRFFMYLFVSSMFFWRFWRRFVSFDP